MALDRLVPTSSTIGAVTGDDYMDKVAEEITGLWNRSTCSLTNVAGTGDAITADMAPALTAGLVEGMSFWLTPTANNTGAATIAINGAAAVDIVDVDGNPLAGGALATGRRYLLSVVSGDLRIVGSGSGGGSYRKTIYLASTTWTKPDGLVKVIVTVQAGGGGSGGCASTVSNGCSASGAGGGAAIADIDADDLSATETITVGSGGTPGASGANAGGTGGSSSFGTHAVATGGGGGATASGTSNRWPPVATGGVGTAGDILLRGGTNGIEATVSSLINSWPGGASAMGHAGGVAVTGGNGSSAEANSGAGAGGSQTNGFNRSGGTGGSGYVIVEEFF